MEVKGKSYARLGIVMKPRFQSTIDTHSKYACITDDSSCMFYRYLHVSCVQINFRVMNSMCQWHNLQHVPSELRGQLCWLLPFPPKHFDLATFVPLPFSAF
jgi:hypothetical protein